MAANPYRTGSKGKKALPRGVKDINKTRKTEGTAKHADSENLNIIENIHDGYFEIDLAGNYTFINDALCEIHGYSKEELIGKNNRQYTDKENAKKAFESFSQIFKTGKTGKIFDYEIIRKDGTKRQLEVSASLIKDSSATVTGFRGIIRDITERKQAEETLALSEARYRTILEEMDEGYFEVDLAGHYTFVNEANCRLLGYDREELIGKSYRCQMEEKDIQTVTNAFGRIYQTGKPERNINYTAIRKDGTLGYAEITGFPLQNRKGETIGFRGVARDITERKRTEEALALSEERFRSILDETQEAYYELDLAGNFTFVNNTLCDHIGYTREELLGMNFRGHVYKDDVERVYNIFARIYMTGRPERRMSYRIDCKDGTMMIVENTGLPLYNQKGEIVGFRGIAQDITKSKEMEEALRQSEERYRTVMDEIEEWYFETDLAGNVVFFNDIFARVLGYSSEQLAGLNYRIFIKPEEVDTVFKIFNHIYKTGETVKNFPQEFVRPNGNITFAEFSILPKRNQEGKIFGFRVIGHDITERKRTEQQLNYMATHDPLTGLPNRFLLMDRLKMALANAKRNRYKIAVMVLDLDHFKTVNDTLGHLTGDQLLKEIGGRLTGLLRQNDTVARLGGDEFVVLLSEIGKMDNAGEVAKKIIKAIAEPFVYTGHRINSSTSIGIAMYPEDGEDTEKMLKNADAAMYYAKSQGRSNYQFFANVTEI